jgi:hypothetical protein
MIAYRKKELRKELSATPEGTTAGFGTTIQRSSTLPILGSKNQAQQRLGSGFQKLRGWSALVEESTSSRQPAAISVSTPPSLSTEEIEVRARDDVESEIHLYLLHPTINVDMSACDIIAFWQVSCSQSCWQTRVNIL